MPSYKLTNGATKILRIRPSDPSQKYLYDDEIGGRAGRKSGVFTVDFGSDDEFVLISSGAMLVGDNVRPIGMNSEGSALAKLATDYESAICVGEFYAKLGANTTVPTGVASPVHLQFSNVIRDDLSIYDSVNHYIVIPDDIVKIDCEYAVELKNDAVATSGTVRGFTMNAADGSAISGLAALTCTKVGMVGGVYGRCCFSVPIPVADYPGDSRKIKPQFRHDAGTNLYVGDSSGSGVAQTFIRVRMYRMP